MKLEEQLQDTLLIEILDGMISERFERISSGSEINSDEEVLGQKL